MMRDDKNLKNMGRHLNAKFRSILHTDVEGPMQLTEGGQEVVKVTITGDGFLTHMVRSVTMTIF